MKKDTPLRVFSFYFREMDLRTGRVRRPLFPITYFTARFCKLLRNLRGFASQSFRKKQKNEPLVRERDLRTQRVRHALFSITYFPARSCKLLRNLRGSASHNFRKKQKNEPLVRSFVFTEREGFEPSKRFWRLRDFQSRAFDHSAISPYETASFARPVKYITERRFCQDKNRKKCKIS